MKRAVTLPRPEIRFPEPGWRERLLENAARAERAGLDLKVELAPGASDEALARLESSVGRLPQDLRELLRRRVPALLPFI